MIETANFTNQFLIAMPNLGDPNFSQTVTFLCQHNSEGALGIVINRPTDMMLHEVLLQMDIEVKDLNAARLPIYFGGPVQPERGFVIHQPVGDWLSSHRVTDTVALTTSRDILEAVAIGEGPEKFLVALGYAGWGEGQLEREMIDNAWLNTPVESDILFDVSPEQRWESAAGKIGVDLNLLSSVAGHA